MGVGIIACEKKVEGDMVNPSSSESRDVRQLHFAGHTALCLGLNRFHPEYRSIVDRLDLISSIVVCLSGRKLAVAVSSLVI